MRSEEFRVLAALRSEELVFASSLSPRSSVGLGTVAVVLEEQAVVVTTIKINSVVAKKRRILLILIRIFIPPISPFDTIFKVQILRREGKNLFLL